MNPPPRAPSPIDLDARRTAIAGKSDAELIQLGRQLFSDECVAPAVEGSVQTHDGIKVYIYPDAYDHAFYTAATRARRGYAKDCIDPARVERVRWIIPIIAGEVEGRECWEITEYEAYRRPPPIKRLYVYKPDPYVIWLPRRRDATTFMFKTAYVTGWSDVSRYTNRQRKIWSR